MACTILSLSSLVTDPDGFIYIWEYRYIFIEKVFLSGFWIKSNSWRSRKAPCVLNDAYPFGDLSVTLLKWDMLYLPP